MSTQTKHMKIEYGADSEGRRTATTPHYRGLLARGQTDEEALRKLMAMIELVERHHKRIRSDQ